MSGLVFGGTAGVKIAAELGVADLLGRTETLVMGSAAASVLAWWALGFAVKSLERGVGRRFDETRKRDER